MNNNNIITIANYPDYTKDEKMYDIVKLEKLPEIKNFKASRGVQVKLHQDNTSKFLVVVKHYFPKTFHLHDQLFQHETQLLLKLKSCPFVPKLYGIDMRDYKHYIIYMSYCGQPLKKWSESQAQLVEQLLKSLEYQWRVRWKPKKILFGARRPHKRNICWLDNLPYLIDFNSFHWKII